MKLDCIKKIIQFPMETSNTRILQMFMYFRSFSVSIFMRENWPRVGAEAAEPIKFQLLLKNYGSVKDLIGSHCTKFTKLVTVEANLSIPLRDSVSSSGH